MIIKTKVASIELTNNQNYLLTLVVDDVGCSTCSAGKACCSKQFNRKNQPIKLTTKNSRFSLGDQIMLKVDTNKFYLAILVFYIIPMIIILGSSLLFNYLSFTNIYSFVLIISLILVYALSIRLINIKSSVVYSIVD